MDDSKTEVMGVETEGMVFTAFLDLLGFKELVLNNTHQQLNEIFNESISRTIDFIGKTSREIHQQFSLEEEIFILMISDSIVIWTNDVSEKSFLGIINATTYLTALCMNRGTPLRGAISLGNISVVKSGESMNVFGDSIVNAYELEKKQDWSGVIVDDKCLNLGNISESKELKELLERQMLVQYNVPMKSGPIRTYHVCNWTTMFHNHGINSEYIEKSFARHNKKIDNWAVKTKIENTIKFFEEQSEKREKLIVSPR